MFLANITMRNRKRGELIVFDRVTVNRRRHRWTFYNGEEVVLHARWSDIDKIELIN